MTTPLEWALAIAAGGIVAPLVVAWVLGERGRRDGVLFAGGILVFTIGVAGVVALIRGDAGGDFNLIFALLLAFGLRRRWRLANRPGAVDW